MPRLRRPRRRQPRSRKSSPALSEDLKENLDLPLLGLQRLRAEHQVELFYDVHITPWLQLTGDLQIIRPNRPDVDTAYVPGGRLRIVF